MLIIPKGKSLCSENIINAFLKDQSFRALWFGSFLWEAEWTKNWCCEDAKDQNDIIKSITMYKIVIQSHIQPN